MKNLNKKIVFFDIDGTIYRYGEPIPNDTLEAIKSLKQNGHLAIICTGRTKSMIFPEILEIGFDGIIAGAGTYVEFDGKVLDEYRMSDEQAKEVISVMKESNIMAIPEGIEAIYFDTELMPKEYVPIYELYIEKVGSSAIALNKDMKVNISKISGRYLEGTDREKFINRYKESFNIVNHGKNFIEMIPKGYSKAVGIEKLINELGIPKENTYAFGDGMNDYEMLKYVQFGVAMGNSAEEFKAMMEYVTEDFNKGGIYNALHRFGLI